MVDRVRFPLGSLTLGIALLLFADPIRATAQQQLPVFRTGTEVVSLFVTVTDRDRRLVPNLTQEDFSVFDDGKPQPIVFFENQVQPITVIVMLDTSASMTATLDLLRDAAEQFLIRLLPADRGRVGAFNDRIQFNGGLTGDRDELIAAMRDLDYGNATRLYDALIASLDELRGIEGRKVILVFTDGEDTSSRAGLGSVVDRSREEEVMVYAIGLESAYFNGSRMVRSQPDRGLRRLAEESGGGYFELQRTADLAPTFTRVAQELHSQYVIGFAPPQLDNRVHRVEVRTTQPGATARARRSYLADPNVLGPAGDRP
jgi:Ca-activated chloride channel family protein